MKRHPVLSIAVILWVTLAIPTAWALAVSYSNQQAIHRQQVRLIDYQVTNKIDGCTASNNGRAALQSVLDSAAHPPLTGTQRLDFTQVPGWSTLPPATQAYFLSLQVQLSKPQPPSFLVAIAANYRKTNPSDVDCIRVGRQLRQTLAAH